jgi:hypothetical protein
MVVYEGDSDDNVREAAWKLLEKIALVDSKYSCPASLAFPNFALELSFVVKSTLLRICTLEFKQGLHEHQMCAVNFVRFLSMGRSLVQSMTESILISLC